MRKKLEIVEVDGKKFIVVDGEAFDWQVTPEQIHKAEFLIKNDPSVRQGFIGNIFRHICESFSQLVGRKVSLKEINDAIENGYIDV